MLAVGDLRYQAKSWSRPRRVVAKIEWQRGELFPRIGFVLTNSSPPAGKVIKVYNGLGDVENRIKEDKNTLRWDKTSWQSLSPAHPSASPLGRSGCSAAAPYPPGGQAEYTMTP